MLLNYSLWKHRITYSIAPVTTVADRWVSLVLPWRVGINSDFSDLRFTDTKGNSLSYNIASKTDRVTATVKINILTAGTRLIHLYFGNSQAVSKSTAAGTEDNNPVLTAVSGTTNPAYSGVWTLKQGGRLNQQGYFRLGGAGPYPKWRYEGLIKITNPVNQTNYQHKLILTWRPGMRSDFRDIRFAQLNGKRCDYWIESYTSRVSAVVWIEVPTSGQKWLNLYYGNGRAVSESSGANTFDFFDDFSGSSLDTTKWNSTLVAFNSGTGTVAVSGGAITLTQTGGVSKGIGLSSLSAIADNINNIRIKVDSRSTGSTSTAQVRIVLTAAATADPGTFGVYGNCSEGKLYLHNGKGIGDPYIAETFVTSTPVIYDYQNNVENPKLYKNDLLGCTGSGNPTDPSGNYIRIWTYSTSTAISIDWIVARKYAATEPTLTIISHQPNSTRITPYETLGDQPASGTTYIMDPIEISLSLSGSIGVTVLHPLISAGLTLAAVSPTTTLQPVIEADLTLSGSVISKQYIPLDTLDITQFSVSKGVSDDIWAMNADIDGFTQLNTDVLRHATFSTTDHLGVSQSIFAGILPKGSYTIKESENKTTITGYDYAWYLSRQQVQTAFQHNVASINPADIITGLLGGDDWEETTGIMPYHILDVVGWGTTLNSKVFDFTIGTTKKQAIDKICAYCRCIFVVKWIVVEGVAIAAAYFISEDDIDTELDLPYPATFTYPDPYLAESIKPVVKGDERYNRVIVIGRNNAGGVFTATVESPAVTAGDELPIEKIENSGSWTTQTQVDARAAELFAYYNSVAYTYTASADDRMDLELLQKIQITGYTGVSENWMRITKIKKSIKATNNGIEKTVDIEFTENVKWSALRRMYRYSSDDMTNEIETTVDNKLSQIPGMQVGTCTALDGQEATIILESGETITTRCT